MEQSDLAKYLDIIKKPFVIYPPPKGPDQSADWSLTEFIYVDDNPTHIKIQNIKTKKTYDLPLVLVEFASPGVLRLTREVIAWNGSFV